MNYVRSLSHYTILLVINNQNEYNNEQFSVDVTQVFSPCIQDEMGNELFLGASSIGIFVKHLNGQPTVTFK